MKYRRQFGNNQMFYLLGITIIAALLILRDVVDVSLSKEVFIAIYIILWILLSKKNSILLLVFTVPLVWGLPTNYIIISFIVIFIIKFYKSIRFKYTSLISLLVISLIEIINGYFYQFSILDFLSTVLGLLAIVIVTDHSKSEVNNKDLIDSFIIGILVLLTVIITKSFEQNTLSSFLSLNWRVGVTKITNPDVMTLSVNPNLLSSLVLLGICLLYIKISLYKKGGIVYPFVIVILLLVGVLTFSRTFILGLSLLVLFIFFNGNKNKKFLYVTVSIAIIMISLVILFPEITRQAITFYNQRFSVEDVTGGRTEILSDYNELLFTKTRYIFIGVGSQSYPDKYGYLYAAHNFIQELVLIWGIFGLVSITFLFTSIIRGKLKLLKSNKIILLFPLILILFTSMAGQLFTSGKLYMLTIAILILNKRGITEK